jgi:hypothetical protein
MSMAAISFEELCKKYPIHNVSPYGECVVVPGDKFDPDWEVFLEDCICHNTDWEGKPVTLVKRKTRKGESEKIVYSPEQERKKSEAQAVSEPEPVRSIEKHLVVWTKEEIERFIKLWNKDPDYAKILKSFPNRTKIALIQKATELKKAGIIENAYVVKAKLKKKEPLKPVPKINVRPVGSPIFRRDEYLWSKKEEKLVIELWNAKKTVAQIQKELAKTNANSNRSMESRSTVAISSEIARLRVKGLIKPRFEWKKKKETKEEEKALKESQEPEMQKKTSDVPPVEEVERLLFVRGVGYCVRLSENLCRKLGLKEKDFVVIQLEKGKGSIRLIPADIQPRKKIDESLSL